MKKKEGTTDFWKKAVLGGGIALLLAGIAYGAGAFYYRNHFFYGTRINGLDCRNLTTEEAEQKIKEKIEDYTLEICLREGKKERISGTEIGYRYVPHKGAEQALEQQNPMAWIKGFFQRTNHEIEENILFDEGLLKEKLQNLDCVQEANIKPPKDAYIAFENNQFVIKKEEPGTTIEQEKLQEKVKEAVQKSQGRFSAEEAGVYKAPAVTRNDEALKKQQEVWNGCAAVTVTYTFGEKREVLDGMTVKDWLTYDENGNYLENSGVLQEHIREYVNMLGEKYNTVGKPRTITSTSTGQPVSVEGGTYGFRIDAQAERQQLLADIQAHANVEREPVYARRGAVYGANDLGGTYVEIDLTAQHLWYYKDGMLLMDSDFVSGTYYDYSRQTPGGTYTLKAKQRNQVLRPAPNEDGSYDYESPVSYWLPFNGGIGLHDANWRWNFGGNIYLYGGSHGCINLPVSFAGNFYENIEVGCPIVCFYR